MKITRAVTVAVGACALMLPLAPPASAQEFAPGVTVVAEELGGPLQVEVLPNGTIVVAEAFAGQVTQIDKKGRRSVLASGLGAFSPGIGVQGGQVFVTASDFTEEGPDGPGSQTGARLVTISQGGRVTHSVDLLRYELDNNPDGQVQFHPTTGEELDALTNPYDVLALPGRTLIADAGANVINQVLANGRISTLTVLPVSREGGCAEVPNNLALTPDGTDVEGFGCDPVPTGIVLGPDGFLYVSGLGGEVEDGGHVWKIDARTGEIVDTFSGLPPLTGIAVAPDGRLYVSTIDFATFSGQVLQLDPRTGAVTGTVDLPPATGLTWADGRLLVTGGFTGQLLSVERTAFTQP